MKREEAKQLSEIIKAYGEGKTIQLFNGKNWVDQKSDNLYFTESVNNYRIKPELTYRPFKNITELEKATSLPAHAPYNWLHSIKEDTKSCCIINTSEDSVTIYENGELVSHDFEYMFYNYKFSNEDPFGYKDYEY